MDRTYYLWDGYQANQCPECGEPDGLALAHVYLEDSTQPSGAHLILIAQCRSCSYVDTTDYIVSDLPSYLDIIDAPADRKPDRPRPADQSLDDPALDKFFADLAEDRERRAIDDAERAEAEERGIPDFDDMGFMRGHVPPSRPEDL